MLTLHLALANQQINVHVNGKESHQFSLIDLSQSKAEWNDFFYNPRIYGEKLFNALFRDAAKIELDALSKQSVRTIVLVLESSELDVIAWEYAYNTAKEEYVVEDCAFVRALPESERPANRRLKASYERVPLLFIPANPLVDVSGEPLRALDEESEWKEMSKHIIASNAGFDLLMMLPATPVQLQTVMAQFRDGLIVHFSGHGGVQDGKAILLFEAENGASNPLDAREFVREIKDKAAITFLSACQSAVAERTEFSNLARGLVKAGVPFALGMQFNLPDPFAPEISGQFYNYLTRGHGVPEAARQARRAVKREHEFYVGMIALYAAHPDEVGQLNWSGKNVQTVSLFRPADVSDLPAPASGLIGRQRELMRIGTGLLEAKKPLTVTLHGAGGIGKTALLWQALLRFAPSFDLTLALALDPLPSLESVLGRIERFLGLPSPCSNDTKEREALVRNALTSKRTLLGLDNFETLNYALNEKGSDEEKTTKSLHTFFKSLAANGVMLCITSREVTNLPGETIIDIEGLTNENGGRLFQENVVRQRSEIYIEKTQQVSEMVGGHPLALRLLASAFDDQIGTSLDQYIESLQSFLPKARDKWTEEDRHQSLRASFDFTMRNLVKTEKGENLQISLSRLSIFIAYFVPRLVSQVITNKIPETKDEKKEQDTNAERLCHALWERGLLERSIIPLQDENFYLYRMHPALRIFAKEKLSDANTVRGNYWRSMSNLAYMAEEQMTKSTLMVQIVSRAMPDLMLASEIGDNRDAALMQFRISKFLLQFGLYDDCMSQLYKSLAIFENLDDLQGKGSTLHQIGRIFVTRGDLDGAMKLYQQSLEIKKGKGDLEGKSATLHEMAKIYITRGDLSEAMNLYQQSLEIDEGSGDLDGKATNLRGMAGIYVAREDLDKAMKLYAQSLVIDEKLGDLEGKSATLHGMAEIYITRGNLSEAMNLYQQSLEIDESLGDLKGKASALHEIAHTLRLHGDLDEAVSLYQQALEIFEGLGDVKSMAATLHGIANILRVQDDLDGAINLYQQVLEIAEGLGELRGKAMTLGMISKVYWANKNHKDAIASLLQGLAQLAELQIEPSAQQAMVSDMSSWRHELGTKKFDALWKEVTGQDIPNWLTR